MRMKPKVKKLWVEALRSGKFKKGKQHLGIKSKASGNEYYCCLGVLCELFPKKKLLDKRWNSYNDATYRDGKLRQQSYLPKVVRDWAGLKQDDPVLLKKAVDKFMLSEYSEPTLSLLNDRGKGASFKKIAEVIEKYF